MSAILAEEAREWVVERSLYTVTTLTLPCSFLFLDFNNGMVLSYFRNNSKHSAIIVNDFDMVTALLGRVIINKTQ